MPHRILRQNADPTEEIGKCGQDLTLFAQLCKLKTALFMEHRLHKINLPSFYQPFSSLWWRIPNSKRKRASGIQKL